VHRIRVPEMREVAPRRGSFQGFFERPGRA
jgi:hypothetical protein